LHISEKLSDDERAEKFAKSKDKYIVLLESIAKNLGYKDTVVWTDIKNSYMPVWISKDWDTTGNLYIEGDNLEVLKLLQKSYHKKVKMIYIDPPYNTGKEFVYPDDYSDSIENYKKITGQVDDEGNRISTNTEANGRYHTDWLNMMYPRLRLARNLLTDDGVIFISIDDHEMDNLKKICNEVFGEENMISIFPRLTTKSGKTPLTYMISHDYVLCYTKINKNIFIGKDYTDDSYKYADEYEEIRGKYNLKQPLDCNSISYSKALDYPIEHEGFTYYPGGDYEQYIKRKNGNYSSKDYAWRWSKELFEFGFENGWIVFQNGRIYTKGYLNAIIEKSKKGGYQIIIKEKTRKISTIDFIINEYSNDIANKQLASLKIDAKFDYPKPVNLIKILLSTYYLKDALILDFFSGSATTAHAVMQLNAEDGGNRKFSAFNFQSRQTIKAKR
jgi:Adenine specific DNA methylase Mod